MYRMIGADGREYGPISADQLRQWIGQGRANAATNVLPEGASEWKPLGSLPEFSMLFAASTPQSPAQQPHTQAPVTPAVFPSQPFPAQRTNPFAIVSLVLGILAFTFGFCCCYGLPFSVPGLVFSFIALSQIKSSPEQYTGKGMTIAGIVLCCLSLLIAAVMFCFGMASVFWDSHHGHRL